jgi:enolase
LQIYYKVAAAIKKSLSSHKLGENGFKPNASGSWFNAHENHNETFKLIEDAITQSGANATNQILSIGISVDPDQFFLPDQGKYDIDGPKNLYDNKMLTDWYIKILNEHPLVTYLEDPVRMMDV